jgi:hypothetical protein
MPGTREAGVERVCLRMSTMDFKPTPLRIVDVLLWSLRMGMVVYGCASHKDSGVIQKSRGSG